MASPFGLSVKYPKTAQVELKSGGVEARVTRYDVVILSKDDSLTVSIWKTLDIDMGYCVTLVEAPGGRRRQGVRRQLGLLRQAVRRVSHRRGQAPPVGPGQSLFYTFYGARNIIHSSLVTTQPSNRMRLSSRSSRRRKRLRRRMECVLIHDAQTVPGNVPGECVLVHIDIINQ